MNKSHCTLEFRHFGTAKLELFANGVANRNYSNPISFHNPTIAQPAFGLLQTAYNSAAADYATYGATKKTALTNAERALVDGLNLLAEYVSTVAEGDQSLIILAGFVPSITVPQSYIFVNRINTFSVRRTNNIGKIVVEIPADTGRGGINDTLYLCRSYPTNNNCHSQWTTTNRSRPYQG